MNFIQAFIIILLSSALIQAQWRNCTVEQRSFCGQFLASGGIQCQRNNQTVCYHEDMAANDKDYCFTNATYNCRTFISRYGYLCDSNNCINSNNLI
ncbi:hypothetical protein EDC96DRAFT_495641 [Choanephora cucurbitarum]|nr:hypothetical protein EDC96DRAFT_495641 [Choanephora cucurbitarum]